MANRLPILILAGDVFANRRPDPVLQQVEHFNNPTTTVNDAFRAVTRYWDRITHPEQIISSLPQAVATMLDPADCGPAFLGLCQDTQELAFDYPEAFFEPRIHHIRRARPDRGEIARAAALLKKAKKPLVIAGGGVRYSFAEAALTEFAEKHRLPVAETIAGRALLVHEHPHNVGPIGVIGAASANALAGDADVVVAIGTRLQDFTTGSWSVFSPEARIISINAGRFDATKHRALSVVADAREAIGELGAALGDWRAEQSWMQRAAKEYAALERHGRQGDQADQHQRAELCAGGGRGEPGRRRDRPRAHRRRRLPRRALQELAGEDARHVRLRVRLLLHGLRDRRRLGRQDGRREPRRALLHRRRLLPDDELRHLFDGADRP